MCDYLRSQWRLWYAPPMKEIVPSEPNFSERVLQYSDELSPFLSDPAKVAGSMNRIPKKQAQKQRLIQAMAEAFEIVGGVPRLALYADKNYGEFLKIIGKQIPVLVQNSIGIQANGPVTIVSAIPASTLDGEVLENRPNDE